MTNKFFYLLVTMLAAVSMASCSNDKDGSVNGLNEFVPISFTSAEQAVVSQTKSFDWELVKAVDSHVSGSFMISPLSAVMNLSMLANGADGATLQQILDALNIKADDTGTLNTYAQKLFDGIVSADNSTDLQIANALFVAPDFEVYDDFKKNMEYWYRADVLPVATDGSGNINTWVSNKTKGRISSLIDPKEESSAKYALANTLYFDAIWQSPFSKSATIKDVFHASKGDQEADFMCKTKSVILSQDDQLAKVRLAFGNMAFSIEFILPHEGIELDDILPNLDYDRLEGCRNYAYSINLRIPKFSLKSQIDLKDPLRECGIIDAFSAEADFSRLMEISTMVDIMRQGCVFEIDEDGVKAAAATVSSGTVSDAQPIEDGGNFFLDRPFLFLIRENSSGACLFMGKVEEV